MSSNTSTPADSPLTPLAFKFAPRFRKRTTIGGSSCVVPICYNNTKEDKGRVSFNYFPRDKKLRRAWNIFVKRPESWKPGVICGNHFTDGAPSRKCCTPTIRPSPPVGKPIPSDRARPKSKWQQMRATMLESAGNSDEEASESAPTRNDASEGNESLPVVSVPQEIVSLTEKCERLQCQVDRLNFR